MNIGASVIMILVILSASPEDSLREQLSSMDAKIRIKAYQRLASKGTNAKSYIPFLLGALQKEESPAARMEILESICMIDKSDDSVIKEIINRFNDKEAEVRLHALGLAWDTIGEPGVKHYVDFVNKRKDPRSRFYGLTAIGMTYSKIKGKKIPASVVKCLEEHLFNPNLDTRLNASLAFQKIAGKEGTLDCLPTINKAFIEFNGNRGNFVRIYRAYGERSLPYLKKNLQHSDAEVRLRTIITLGYMEPVSRPLIPEIEKLLQDPSEDVRWEASFALEYSFSRKSRK